MAGLRIDPGCCRGVLLAALLSGVAIGGLLGCRQVAPSAMRFDMRPSDWASRNAASAERGIALRDTVRDEPVARGQTPPGTATAGPLLPEERLPGEAPPDAASGDQVVEVRVVGARQTPVAEILRQIHTRAGRPFDPELLEDDIRRLYRTRKFVEVDPRYQEVPGGRIVIFEVLERPILEYVKYVGNQKVPKKKLEKESGIKTGDALDPFAVSEGRRRLEEFYRGKGFAKAQVRIAEGNKESDRGAIYLINEGQKQQIGWTGFVGNTIASDAKLRTKIRSKPGVFWIFKGELNRKEIDEDIERLTDYYRSLGYFRAHISRLPVDPTKRWQLLTFVINEGPRYVVRNVSFIGNAKFTTEELAERLELQPGEFFNQAQMQSDLAAVRDKYGAVGHIFADINVDTRLLEEPPGQLDLVYEIKEGEPYRVGRIDVDILGDNPHTQITTVLNRLSLHPGEIVDVRELRASERRLRASNLFEVDPTQGIAPQIVVRPPGLEDVETEIARQPADRPGSRGRRPGPMPHQAFRPPGTTGPVPPGRVVDLHVRGRWAGDSRVVVRGQSYSADAGQSVPPLPLAQPRRDAQPSQQGGPYLPSADVAPATASEVSPNQPSGGAAAYDPAAPVVSRQAGGTVAPSPAYASQYGAGSGTATPGGGQPLGLFSPNAPTADDGSLLLGNPPNEDPLLYAPLFPQVQETRTGRLMFSAGINSEAGLIGSVIMDEQNFDWLRFPRSWEDIRDGTAWRGAGQRFRLEAVPGTEVQKYTISFQEPYLLDTAVSLGLGGFFYNRWYDEWHEERLGGRVALGYQFTHDLSGTLAFRGENVQIYDPITPTPAELAEVLGENALFGFRAQLTHDTRDNSFLATEGHLFEIGVEQVIGSFTYTRGDIDLRKYFMLRQHPDGSGRHVLSLNARAAITSDDTPIYEHYYAGGFSTIRGFDFRGASPRDANNVLVGGHFMLLASVEYMFPITADDNLRAVIFCDSGTVEPTIDNWTDDYRVAPGFGLRIVIPAMGPAPIALDFAFPVCEEPSDEDEVFSFFIGFLR